MIINQNKLFWSLLIGIATAAAALLLPLEKVTPISAEPSVPILIIDAGHGGADGGAVAANGTKESDVNLDIAKKLEALAVFWGVETVMTRESDTIDYPPEAATLAAMKKADQNDRLAKINAVPGAILICIHQNYYPAASPWGIQVFFGAVDGSDRLADRMQENLTSQLCPNNRRSAERIDEGIYLMRKAQCRAVLVECGFLSNPEELGKLETPAYRTQLAVVMLASYLQYITGEIV